MANPKEKLQGEEQPHSAWAVQNLPVGTDTYLCIIYHRTNKAGKHSSTQFTETRGVDSLENAIQLQGMKALINGISYI